MFRYLWAWYNFQLSATHPDPEADLDVLAAPDLHPLVIPAQLLEPVPGHSEQAPGDGGGGHTGRGVSLLSGSVWGWEPLPEKVEAPVETASKVSWHRLEVEVREVYVVDDGGGDRLPV